MNPATADESPSKHHPWWKSKYVIYDIVMHILLITSNFATFLYMKLSKIPIAGNKILMIELICLYLLFGGFFGVLLWAFTFDKNPEKEFTGGTLEHVSHIFGLVFLIILFYSISPLLALCFGIPSSLWFLSVFLVSAYFSCSQSSCEG